MNHEIWLHKIGFIDPRRGDCCRIRLGTLTDDDIEAMFGKSSDVFSVGTWHNRLLGSALEAAEKLAVEIIRRRHGLNVCGREAVVTHGRKDIRSNRLGYISGNGPCPPYDPPGGPCVELTFDLSKEIGEYLRMSAMSKVKRGL